MIECISHLLGWMQLLEQVQVMYDVDNRNMPFLSLVLSSIERLAVNTQVNLSAWPGD